MVKRRTQGIDYAAEVRDRSEARRLTRNQSMGMPQYDMQPMDAQSYLDFWTPAASIILHVNIQGFVSHAAELSARIQMMVIKPSIICLNETFLDASIKSVTLEGYELVGRRDRRDGRECGGVAMFVLAIQANNVTLLHESKSSERLWAIVHSDLGPYLVCAWYRPPEPGETDSIATLAKEYEELSPGMLGTIITGDMKVHQKRWLWKSSRNSGEGEALHKFCLGKGLQQLVREATREQYMLDLVMSDVETLKCKVLPKIADHNLVHAHFNLLVPKTNVRERLVWKYVNADW